MAKPSYSSLPLELRLHILEFALDTHLDPPQQLTEQITNAIKTEYSLNQDSKDIQNIFFNKTPTTTSLMLVSKDFKRDVCRILSKPTRPVLDLLIGFPLKRKRRQYDWHSLMREDITQRYEYWVLMATWLQPPRIHQKVIPRLDIRVRGKKGLVKDVGDLANRWLRAVLLPVFERGIFEDPYKFVQRFCAPGNRINRLRFSFIATSDTHRVSYPPVERITETDVDDLNPLWNDLFGLCNFFSSMDITLTEALAQYVDEIELAVNDTPVFRLRPLTASAGLRMKNMALTINRPYLQAIGFILNIRIHAVISIDLPGESGFMCQGHMPEVPTWEDLLLIEDAETA
ncbi:hypothetical protein BU24DRAFT_465309 [Aaosphaeria arxii CBS 175.79]|uniref:F-box domain-containing protein n=1 Tax=Aaosphaeria arxii CBS 175.79 TaxID=1450172 RepID=A0A6A5XKZ4_9PLEO|nr:uncharacterized protein BU24DRAFT_465309 [Aaosphaeria arxii CBS 175.79]KAF2012964.1 hypothetical protein BU24DRAFT_465309 [Aaosphaeria arxii CBS 175.79]